MTGEKIGEPKLLNIKQINPYLAKTDIKILYEGMNQKDMFINHEMCLKLMESLRGCAIVGCWDIEEQDFKGHEYKHGVKSDGTIGRTRKTSPIGFIDLNAKIWEQKFEELDSNGNKVIRNYFMTEGILWDADEPLTKTILKDKSSQSVEFEPESMKGIWSKDVNLDIEFFFLNEGNLRRLCVLGKKIEPCYEGACFAPASNFSLSKQDEEEIILYLCSLEKNKQGEIFMNENKETSLDETKEEKNTELNETKDSETKDSETKDNEKKEEKLEEQKEEIKEQKEEKKEETEKKEELKEGENKESEENASDNESEGSSVPSECSRQDLVSEQLNSIEKALNSLAEKIAEIVNCEKDKKNDEKSKCEKDDDKDKENDEQDDKNDKDDDQDDKEEKNKKSTCSLEDKEKECLVSEFSLLSKEEMKELLGKSSKEEENKNQSILEQLATFSLEQPNIKGLKQDGEEVSLADYLLKIKN